MSEDYCIICGINKRRSLGILSTKLTCGGDNCVEQYKLILEHRRSDSQSGIYPGFCRVCGDPLGIKIHSSNRIYFHRKCSAKRIIIHKSTFKAEKPQTKIFLKPWDDPESLFCDTDFLEDLMKKDIAKGDECKDNK